MYPSANHLISLSLSFSTRKAGGPASSYLFTVERPSEELKLEAGTERELTIVHHLRAVL